MIYVGMFFCVVVFVIIIVAFRENYLLSLENKVLKKAMDQALLSILQKSKTENGMFMTTIWTKCLPNKDKYHLLQRLRAWNVSAIETLPKKKKEVLNGYSIRCSIFYRVVSLWTIFWHNHIQYFLLYRTNNRLWNLGIPHSCGVVKVNFL